MKTQKKVHLPVFDKQDLISIVMIILVSLLVWYSLPIENVEDPAEEQDGTEGWVSPTGGTIKKYEEPPPLDDKSSGYFLYFFILLKINVRGSFFFHQKYFLKGSPEVLVYKSAEAEENLTSECQVILVF